MVGCSFRCSLFVVCRSLFVVKLSLKGKVETEAMHVLSFVRSFVGLA